ncbi:helix-turn-helix domain-containing protein [Nonomuraea sp. B12E4]|uniref:AraC-like ligand-binding domain-containing protein n=1 Tax=Nonomuraea sp. B12E4 TaxID=3153564 RepID=UPI00325CE634
MGLILRMPPHAGPRPQVWSRQYFRPGSDTQVNSSGRKREGGRRQEDALVRGRSVVLESVWRTVDVPPMDRFDLWREKTASTVCPMDMTSPHAEDFRAEMRQVRLGEVGVWRADCQQMDFHRTARLIRRSDPESYQLAFPLTGAVGISQAGRQEVHGSHQMYLVTTSQPFVGRNFPAMRVVGLEVPRHRLPLPDQSVDGLVTRPLPGHRGVGGLLAGTLTRVLRDSGTYRAADASRLEAVVVDLFSATLAHHLDTEDALPAHTRSRTLALRIQSFVRRHLHDPDLTPRTIAAAHHISTGHLHRLFHTLGHDATLAAWIRRERLERARRDLADPAQRATPVQHIAGRWGFTDAAVFSRSFRAAFGAPPRDYRHHALTDTAAGTGEPSSSAPPPNSA